MVRIKNLAALILVSFLTFAGCSDLGKNSIVNKPIESNRFNAGCTLNIDEFKMILERDVSAQISCLQKNIDLFMRVVESDKPGYLSRTAFEQYVIKNMPDFKPENVRAIKSVFDIAHLIFGDDRNYLSPGSVKKIFDFIYLFNREFPIVYPFFESEEENTPYYVHDLQRKRIFKAGDSIAEALIRIYKGSRGDQIHKINIIEILESFTNTESEDVLAKTKAVIFIKKVILGGVKDELNHIELSELLSKLPKLGMIVFDIFRVGYIDLNQKSLLEFINSDLDLIDDPLKPLLHYTADSGERLFSIDDLIAAVPFFLSDNTDFPDLKQYRKEILQAKMLLMSESAYSANEDLRGKEFILPSDLRVFLDTAKDMVRRGAVYHNVYEFFKPYLNSPGVVSINYNNYVLSFPTHGKYVEEFARIANSYRFFYGEFDMPFYSAAFRRNSEGMVEQGLMESALKLVARRYGSPNPGVGGFGLSLAQLQAFITLIKKPLVDEGLITAGRELKLMENITLLMTLFQSMSNGDGIINVDEGSAFFTQVFASMAHSDYFQEEISKVCSTDERGRITDIDCHRSNYFNVLCSKFQNNYPVLLQALGVTNCADKGDQTYIKDYLKTIEFVGRTCTVFKDGTDVPLTSDDYMPIMVMIQTIEGTMLRYDTNRNNTLDPSEVRKAYDQTLKIAIEALVEEQASVIAKLPFNLGSAISKKVYYYLIKYKAVPKKVSEYLKLLTIGATPARRDTFAAVLKIVAEQGEPSTFDCETLR
jgi:hypothetical protein